MVIWAVFISVIAVTLLLGLRMSFDEPKPFVFAARDFPEHIRSLSILQLCRLINGFADFAPESASVRRFEGTHHKNITVREQVVIPFSPELRTRSSAVPSKATKGGRS